jgi:HSP20 family protein
MEKNYTDQSHQCTLYPGEYFPLLDEQELSRALQLSRKVNTVSPALKLSEQELFFKVEAAMPGLHREDFFIRIDEHVLSIAVLHKQEGPGDEQCFKIHEFNYDCYNRKLTLPQNAETSFVKAEYKEGMLNMYLPKSKFPTREAHTQVIVY